MVSGHDQHPGGDQLITGVGGRPAVRGTRLIPASSARMSSRPAAMSRGSAIDSATSTIRGDGASHLTAVVDQRYRGPPVECAEAMADSKRPHLAQTDLKCNSRRFVFGDDRQRAAQLLKHHGLRLDAIALLQPDIASRQAPQRSGQRAQAAPLGAPSCQPSSRAERYRRETQEPANVRSLYRRPATAATPDADVGQQ